MKKIIDSKYKLKDIPDNEYLLTNGLGGYSFSTLWNINARKYHSLYTISKNPPVERQHVVSKFSEKVTTMSGEYILDDFGSFLLYEFERTGCATFRYGIEDFIIEKKLAFKRFSNDLAVTYTCSSKKPVKLEISPLINIRDHHDVENPLLSDYVVVSDTEGVSFRKGENSYFIASNMKFEEKLMYSDEVYYPIEKRRGYPFYEKSISLGNFSAMIDDKKTMRFMISDQFTNTDPEEILSSEEERYQSEMAKLDFEDERIKELAVFSDDFITRRKNTGKLTIMAGYPWFTDWGRDTMISLTGLTLSRGKTDEAKEIMETFLSSMKDGLIPNNFPDEGIEPMYNTSDATLWLFEAIFRYWKKTGDTEFIDKHYDTLKGIIEKHKEGTRNNIRMDKDSLLWQGDIGTQLTWMDVKVDGVVPTPRHGKAVEINALWYNALRIMSELTYDTREKLVYDVLASKVKKSFNKEFPNPKKKYLYDVINENGKLDLIRPNALFSISLSFKVLEEEYFRDVVDTATSKLLTDRGMKTLPKGETEYHPLYE